MDTFSAPTTAIMLNQHRSPIYWSIVAPLLILKAGLHCWANGQYGFQRDEMLYLALGQHLDWGYWSVPPLIGWIAGAITAVAGDGLFVVRLVPTLVGLLVVVLMVGMAREMGAGRFGQWLAGIAGVVSPAFLRTSLLFQPVVFDWFFWTLTLFWLVRYWNSQRSMHLYAAGLSWGLGFLNKYLVVLLLLGLVLGWLLVRQDRRIFWRSSTWLAAGLAALVVAPNLWWQYHYNFPVRTHLRELAATQLVKVQLGDFFMDQIFMHFPVLPIWIAGVGGLLFTKKLRPWRSFGYAILAVVALLLYWQGKSYYTLGIYPLLMAAGAVVWEQVRWWPPLRWVFGVVPLFLLGPLLPMALPVLSIPQMVDYCRSLRAQGLDGLTRWEDGEIHPLPQDYADMLGWEELARITAQAYRQIPPAEGALIYARNYGQASAIYHYRRQLNLPEPQSFNETYLLWAPLHVPTQALVYVGDGDQLQEALGPVFAELRLVGKVRHPYARERGTQVWVGRQPRVDFSRWWKERLLAERANYGIHPPE